MKTAENFKKLFIIVHDPGSKALHEYFKSAETIYLDIPNKISLTLEEIQKIADILKEYDIEDSIIFYGSNRRHFLTLSILLALKNRNKLPKAYLHIDQHSDDYELVENISSGNFIKYVKQILGLKIYYIGFMKPEYPEIFEDYFLIDRKHKNLKEALEFISKLKEKMYISVDLDILKYKYCPNLFNKKISFLLDLDELICILENIKEKIHTIDICGYVPMKDVPKMKVVECYSNILRVLENGYQT